jgi:hypothetical protein
VAQVREVAWSGGSITIGENITPEEQRVIEERMRELDIILAEKKRATYKLEVMFNDERSFHKPFGGTVTWWESGTKLHGGGDAKIYLCPGKERKGNGCEAFLLDKATGLNFIVCGACGSLWRGDQVFGEVYYKLPMEKWADVLLSWFRRLGLDADIRIKYARDDIRSAAMGEQERMRGGELLQNARSDERRSSSIYPLERIIKDTSAGADLHSRILAFLRA